MNARSDDGRPPIAPKSPRTVVLHGETVVDDYWWLREKSNAEVRR
jgi:protease II